MSGVCATSDLGMWSESRVGVCDVMDGGEHARGGAIPHSTQPSPHTHALSQSYYLLNFVSVHAPLFFLMAARGVTAADFGRTNSSKRFNRTKIEDDEDDGPASTSTATGPTPAAAAFAASLREELLQKRDFKRPDASAAAAPPRAPEPKPSSASARREEQPKGTNTVESSQTKKVFLSKAERKQLKKRQRLDGTAMGAAQGAGRAESKKIKKQR